MKAVFALFLGLFLVGSVQAQVFRPASVRGGGHDRHARVEHRSHGHSHRSHWGHSRHRVHVGFGVHRGWHHGHRAWRPYPVRYGYPIYRAYTPVYGYRHYGYYEPAYVGYSSYEPSSRAATGALLGGIAGAIIGNNSGDLRHNAWRGAAIGAGAGLLLGTLADHAQRDQDRGEAVPVYQSAARVEAQSVPTPTPAPQNVTIINHYHGTAQPAKSANSLFGR